MDATATYGKLAASYGTITVRPSIGGLEVVETTINVVNAVVSERPGEGSFIELDNFPVMLATPAVGAAFAALALKAKFACALIALEDDCLRLVAIADGAHVYWDGDEVVLDEDSLPMAA